MKDFKVLADGHELMGANLQPAAESRAKTSTEGRRLAKYLYCNLSWIAYKALFRAMKKP